MMSQRSTVVGVFEDRERAERAITALRQAGFADDQIGLAMRHSASGDTVADETGEGSAAGSGAVAGALTGLGLGALAGLGILAGVIPVVGPAIAGGTLGIILSNAAAGAGLAGLVGALVGSGIPEEEAHYYEGEFEAGRVLVTVKADGRADEASSILRQHGAYDMQTRPGATGMNLGAAAGTAATARTGAAGEKIQVVEEQLRARKTAVEAGEVRVRKEVHTEHQTLDVPVRREEVVIERHPVAGGQVADASQVGDTGEIRIPVMEEQVHVEKTPVVKEEVSVGKRVVKDTERVTGEVRREDVRVEKSGDVDVTKRGDACDR